VKNREGTVYEGTCWPGKIQYTWKWKSYRNIAVPAVTFKSQNGSEIIPSIDYNFYKLSIILY